MILSPLAKYIIGLERQNVKLKIFFVIAAYDAIYYAIKYYNLLDKNKEKNEEKGE